jgi:hypothetical protein
MLVDLATLQVPAPRTVSRATWAAAAAALCVTVGVWTLGLLTSLAFNATLGRVEGFGDESVLTQWRYGQQALFVPALIALATALVLLACRPIWRPLIGAGGRVFKRLRLSASAATAGQWLLLGQLAAAIIIGWRFRDILGAVMVRVNDASTSALTPLAPGGVMVEERAWFTITTSVSLLAMISAWWAILSPRGRIGSGRPLGLAAAGGAVALLLLLVLVTPYRLLYLNKKERVEFEATRCYITGTRPGDLLLYCPDAPPPKNRVVSASDERVHRSNVIESIFTTP